MWCHYCDKKKHSTKIAGQMLRLKRARTVIQRLKGKKSLAFLFEEINLGVKETIEHQSP
jgi:hypothetical protein